MGESEGVLVYNNNSKLHTTRFDPCLKDHHQVDSESNALDDDNEFSNQRIVYKSQSRLSTTIKCREVKYHIARSSRNGEFTRRVSRKAVIAISSFLRGLIRWLRSQLKTKLFKCGWVRVSFQ